jgi:hypothetical protein
MYQSIDPQSCQDANQKISALSAAIVQYTGNFQDTEEDRRDDPLQIWDQFTKGSPQRFFSNHEINEKLGWIHPIKKYIFNLLAAIRRTGSKVLFWIAAPITVTFFILHTCLRGSGSGNDHLGGIVTIYRRICTDIVSVWCG